MKLAPGSTMPFPCSKRQTATEKVPYAGVFCSRAVFRRECNGKIYALMPDVLEDDVFKFEKTKLLTTTHNMMVRTISEAEQMHMMFTAICNSGAGFRFVSKDVPPMSRLESVQSILASMKINEDMTFKVEVLLRMTTKIGERNPSAVFSDASQSASRTGLGTAPTDSALSRAKMQIQKNMPRIHYTAIFALILDDKDVL